MIPGLAISSAWQQLLFFRFLGVLLLATGALKAYGFSVSALPEIGWFSTPSIQAVAVLIEFSIGLWLLTGVSQNLAWLASVVTFSAFSFVSGYLGWNGVASCGCLGAVKASPWFLFCFDIIILLFLFCAKPPVANIIDEFVVLNRNGFLVSICGGFLLVGAILFFGYLKYGSIDCFLARLRNQPINVTQFVDFGDVLPHKNYEIKIPIINFNDVSVRIIGGSSDCNCIATNDLPLIIRPNARADISVYFSVKESSSGRLTKKIELWTDCELQRKIPLTIGCNVRAEP